MLLEAYKSKQIDFGKCTGCELCAQLCPKKAIMMRENDEGFFFPDVDDSICVRCGMCVVGCPVLEPIVTTSANPALLYSGYEKSMKYQERCSSGGIFGLLADKIMQTGGVVFGAAFDATTKTVRHVSSDECDLNDILRSKYVQSRIGNVYMQINDILTTTNRKVLFCGTPCQVEGLLRYVKKDFENLITVDFVCHGVPSPGVFRDMLESEEEKCKGRIKNITFREKNPNGKGEEYLYLYLYDGRRVEYKSLDFYYYYLFLYNVILRKSCMTCARAGSHKSDMTLADDWLQKWQSDPSIGVSLIRINTEKGESVFGVLKDELLVYPVDLKERTITTQVHRYLIKERKVLFQKYRNRKNISTLKHEYYKIRFKNESKKKLIYMLSKCYHTVMPRRKVNDNK